MLSRATPLTLIAAVLLCPFMCGPAQVVRADDDSTPSCCGCCHHGEESSPAEGGSEPSEPSEHGNAFCNCICNGAVIDHAVFPPMGVDLNCWSLVPAAVPLVAVTYGQLSLYQTSCQPDDGMNPGRAMRCLFMTYVC
jgi:hypothetical protein